MMTYRVQKGTIGKILNDDSMSTEQDQWRESEYVQKRTSGERLNENSKYR